MSRPGDPPTPAPVSPDPSAQFLQSFEDLGPLGRGGMGEVRRVRDRSLDRSLALKAMHPDMGDPEDEARFAAEAQIMAQLQHPGVVPIYALGRLADGRVAYAMQEVHGLTLASVIGEVHEAARGGAWTPAPSGWTFRRLVNALGRAAEVVAYAHSRRVIHRDLKPQNIMVGAFGEVFVLDWGLAKVLGASEGPDALRTARTGESAEETQYGAVQGSPAYMPPEQARGATDELGPPADVYGLGAVLFEILTGGPPHGGRSTWQILAASLMGNLAPLQGPAPVPEELAQICRQALALEPADRPADAGVLASQLNDWLDGAHRRDQALAEVSQADALLPEIQSLRERAEAARVEAVTRLEGLQSHSPVEEKLPAWILEDQSAQLRREARLREVAYTQRLHASLRLIPELPEAHARLADHYKRQQEAAERLHDESAALEAETLLRSHDRGRHAAWLRGDGRLDLATEPEGAEVTLFRFDCKEEIGRNL